MQGPMHGAFVGNFNKVRPLIAVQLRTFNMYYTVNFIYLADAGFTVSTISCVNLGVLQGDTHPFQRPLFAGGIHLQRHVVGTGAEC